MGGIYIRDPRGTVTSDQLNGGDFTLLTGQDWQLIEPYLEENDRLFDIPVDDLLCVNGQKLPPDQVYRKIQPHALRALMAEVAWVTEGDDSASRIFFTLSIRVLKNHCLSLTTKLSQLLGTINQLPKANKTRPPIRAQFNGIGSPSAKPRVSTKTPIAI